MAVTKWGKKLSGGLEGVVPNCSKFCFSSGAEGEKGNISPLCFNREEAAC